MSQEDYPGLEVIADREFERRYWYAQRVSWVVLALLLVAGVLGLLGGTGLLVSATTQEPESGLAVEYQRFLRKRSPTTLQINVLANPIQNSELTLHIDREFLEAYSVEDITPQPDDVSAADGYLAYSFQYEDPEEDVTVNFHLRSQRFGILSGWIRREGEAPVDFWQFAYP